MGTEAFRLKQSYVRTGQDPLAITFFEICINGRSFVLTRNGFRLKRGSADSNNRFRPVNPSINQSVAVYAHDTQTATRG